MNISGEHKQQIEYQVMLVDETNNNNNNNTTGKKYKKNLNGEWLALMARRSDVVYIPTYNRIRSTIDITEKTCEI